MLRILNRFSHGHWPIFLLGNLSSILNLFLPIILVRLLSPADMGLYKVFFLYSGLIPFMTLSGGPVNAIYYFIGKKDQRAKYIKNIWLIVSLLSVLGFFPLFILGFLFKGSLNLDLFSLGIVLISSLLICPASYYGEVLLAQGKTIKGSLLSLFFEALKVVGFLVLAFLYRDVQILFIYFLIMMILSFIFMNTLFFKNEAMNFKLDEKEAKDIISYSLPISLSALLLYIMEKADQLILSIFLLTADFAFFSMGSLVIPPLFLLEMSVQKKLIPELSTYFHENKMSEMNKAMKNAISSIAFLIIPSIFGLFLFAEPIVKTLYTDAYLPAAIYLKIFSFSYLLLLIPHDSVLRATGQTKKMLSIYSYFTPFSLVIIFLCAKYTQASTTLMVSIVLKFIPKLICFETSAKLIHSKMSLMIPTKKLMAYSGLSGTLAILSWLIKPLFLNEQIWMFAVIPLFALIYLGTFEIIRHNKSKKE